MADVRIRTLPLLKPMTLFVVITSIISYIQAYVQILIMTEGGPGTATYLASYIIYDEAFVKYNFGYASALSFVLFVITAVFSWLSFRYPEVRNRKCRCERKINSVVLNIGLLLLGLITVYPFCMDDLSSFKQNKEIMAGTAFASTGVYYDQLHEYECAF